MRRVYPRGTLAAQVLGMVGTEGKGLAGLEYSRDALLRGHSGKREVVSESLLSGIRTKIHDAGTALREKDLPRYKTWCQTCDRCDLAGICRNRP